MNPTPRELASRVAKQSSGVSVKFGRTNGQDVLHLIRRRNDEGRTSASVTIPATAPAWNLHPWNKEKMA